MTDEELIVYLRRSAVSYSHPLWKAADRIEALAAERDALKAGQVDAIRAALEAAHDAIAEYPMDAPGVVAMRYDEQIEHSQHIIRALDPAAIAARLKGEK